MKNYEIEKKISHAFESITPNVLDAVLSDCEEQKGKILIMTNNRTSANVWVKRFSGIAAAIALIAGGAFIFAGYNNNFAVASTVSLDVNPSVEINVNQKEKVLSVDALNEDGKTIIGDMDFDGSSLDITVNALIGSMLRNGYLNELTNSILISVDGNDPILSAALQQKVSDEVNAFLATETFAGAVLSQTVQADDNLRAAAEQNGITPGKAQLVQQIVDQNAFYSFDDLAGLSINELNLLTMSSSLTLTDVEKTGTASDKAYIGEAKAKEIALTHAGVSESDIFKYEIELDYDCGVMVYDIEFDAPGIEYDYEINAVDGSVVKSQKENDDDYRKEYTSSENKNALPSPDIDAETAKSIAFQHAGVAADSVFDLQVDLDYERGILVYEIDFQVAANEYEYDINAFDGSVIKHKTKIDDDYIDPALVSEFISEEDAKSAAFTHAGLEATSVYELEIDLDNERGVPVYEIEFKSGEYEYEYEIGASTGEVVKYDKERDD